MKNELISLNKKFEEIQNKKQSKGINFFLKMLIYNEEKVNIELLKEKLRKYKNDVAIAESDLSM